MRSASASLGGAGFSNVSAPVRSLDYAVLGKVRGVQLQREIADSAPPSVILVAADYRRHHFLNFEVIIGQVAFEVRQTLPLRISIVVASRFCDLNVVYEADQRGYGAIMYTASARYTCGCPIGTR